MQFFLYYAILLSTPVINDENVNGFEYAIQASSANKLNSKRNINEIL